MNFVIISAYRGTCDGSGIYKKEEDEDCYPLWGGRPNQTQERENTLTALIENLKKARLLLKLATASENSDTVGAPVSFTFIYGVASEGLCPFESALYEKAVGARLEFAVTAAEAQEFFGHLLLPLREALGLQIIPQKFVLQVEVAAVDDADNREIVESLARAGSGCGGSCGCGC